MNTEEQINEYLVKSLRVYNIYKDTDPKMATQILQQTSRIANLQLMLARFYNLISQTHKVYCPICKEQLKDGLNIQFMKTTGRCILCDHVEGELYDN